MFFLTLALFSCVGITYGLLITFNLQSFSVVEVDSPTSLKTQQSLQHQHLVKLYAYRLLLVLQHMCMRHQIDLKSL